MVNKGTIGSDDTESCVTNGLHFYDVNRREWLEALNAREGHELHFPDKPFKEIQSQYEESTKIYRLALKLSAASALLISGVLTTIVHNYSSAFAAMSVAIVAVVKSGRDMWRSSSSIKKRMYADHRELIRDYVEHIQDQAQASAASNLVKDLNRDVFYGRQITGADLSKLVISDFNMPWGVVPELQQTVQTLRSVFNEGSSFVPEYKKPLADEVQITDQADDAPAAKRSKLVQISVALAVAFKEAGQAYADAFDLYKREVPTLEFPRTYKVQLPQIEDFDGVIENYESKHGVLDLPAYHRREDKKGSTSDLSHAPSVRI